MMVLQIVRVIRHPMCEETIREVASKPNHSNLFSLWIREEVPGLGRFPPLDTNQTLLEQLTGSVHVSMPHMIVEGFTSFVNFSRETNPDTIKSKRNPLKNDSVGAADVGGAEKTIPTLSGAKGVRVSRCKLCVNRKITICLVLGPASFVRDQGFCPSFTRILHCH